MAPEQRIRKQLPILKEHYVGAKIALQYKTPLDLLVATILSAQCTDVRVNIVTKELFKKYKRAQDYAGAVPKVFKQEIRSTGFYRNKAKNIIAMAKMLVEKHGGKVPRMMEELIELPGVARKTANCVLNAAYGIQEGIVVDTHVLRVTRRVGLTRNTDAVKVELDLMKLVPKEDWGTFSFMVQAHGRQICVARNPKCEICPFNKVCPSAYIAKRE